MARRRSGSCTRCHTPPPAGQVSQVCPARVLLLLTRGARDLAHTLSAAWTHGVLFTPVPGRSRDSAHRWERGGGGRVGGSADSIPAWATPAEWPGATAQARGRSGAGCVPIDRGLPHCRHPDWLRMPDLLWWHAYPVLICPYAMGKAFPEA
jgi:hypothetical protein